MMFEKKTPQTFEPRSIAYRRFKFKIHTQSSIICFTFNQWFYKHNNINQNKITIFINYCGVEQTCQCANLFLPQYFFHMYPLNVSALCKLYGLETLQKVLYYIITDCLYNFIEIWNKRYRTSFFHYIKNLLSILFQLG